MKHTVRRRFANHAPGGNRRHDIGGIHFYLAVGCTVLLVLHLVLHWSWICNVTARALGKASPSRGTQKAWGLVLAAGVFLFLAGGLVWATGKVEPYPVPDSPGEHRGRGWSREGHGALLLRANDEWGASPGQLRGRRRGRGQERDLGRTVAGDQEPPGIAERARAKTR